MAAYFDTEDRSRSRCKTGRFSLAAQFFVSGLSSRCTQSSRCVQSMSLFASSSDGSSSLPCVQSLVETVPPLVKEILRSIESKSLSEGA